MQGHWIEMRSVMGASKTLEAPAKLMPSDAHKLMPDGSATDTLVLGDDMDEETLRKYAAAVDANSEHPIAKAIVAASEEKLPVENFKSIPGQGAEGQVEGKEVKVVSPGYLHEHKISMTDERVEPLQAQGKTVVFVLVDGKLKGAIALADIIRPEAKPAIDALKALDIRCMMLTGSFPAPRIGR